MSRSEAYGYAVARIRAMEHRLLDAGSIQRMADADDFQAALKILGETAYARELSSGESAERYDHALEAELLSTYQEVQSFVRDDELVSICRIPYDFHNVKVLLKSVFSARNGGKKRWDLLTSLGSLPVDDLLTNIETEDYRLLPYNLNIVLPICIAQWEQTRDTVEVERLLDKQLFESMLKMAHAFGETGVVEWVRARIDSENIRNLLRLKRFGFDATRASAFMHAGGRVDPGYLASLIVEPFESWGRMLSFTDFGAVLSEIQDTGRFDVLIVELEKSLDEYCLKILRNARYSANAPENVLAYLWSKEMEIKNIRTILVSKSMNQDKEQVRGLLRHGYV